MAAEGPRVVREAVVCDCGQLLAEAWERGAYNIVGTTRIRTDERRRIILVCPRCGKKTRLGWRDAA